MKTQTFVKRTLPVIYTHAYGHEGETFYRNGNPIGKTAYYNACNRNPDGYTLLEAIKTTTGFVEHWTSCNKGKLSVIVETRKA